MKLVLGALLVLAVIGAAALSRRTKAVLLFAWVVALTYNRQYFSFEAIVGDQGGQGPYWIVADIFFVMLLAVWAYEAAVLKRSPEPAGGPAYALYIPFAIVCLVSALGAQRPDWSLYELVRSGKILLILLFVRYNVGRREWWACVAALVCAAVLQSTLGVLEVTTKRSGVLGILGLSQGPVFPEEFSPERFYGWWRATGTMNHPPNLACYLLLAIPLPLSLGLAGAWRRLRPAALAAGMIALAGLACTLSRWPWVLAVGQMGLLAAGLVWLRLVRVERVLGAAVIATFAGLVVLLPFTGFIADRLTRDLEQSIDFRENENRVATAMLDAHPLLGVGPNNYRLYLAEHGSEMTWALASEEIAVRVLKVRFIAAPQNGFLLTLAETGILGFAAFAFYVAAALVLAVRASVVAHREYRPAAFALLVGMIGVIAQQVIDYSLWIDPVLYTFTLAVGLVAVAPSLPACRAEAS